MKSNFWVIATALPFDSDAYFAAIIYFDFGQDDTFAGVSMPLGLINYQLDENTWNVTLSALDENGELSTIVQKVL